ncbi:TatD family hydrolase [Methanobacterium alcaliphilum]|uniref:TatD family hydrolase n=1 Tax=Methanobacterium alcaliphilum TaxID=392018 RepID=UPI002009F4FE|nr:TatD family hydrolase [Methanobacterium alcaliphilum]MCK9151233.1 TatD family hydrolase [Methanobacterium alcaliphilum]
MIDGHIHADTRPYEDFEKMAISGINAAISCAHDPLKMSTSAVIFDHFDRLVNNDRERAAKNGLTLYFALGIHPRSISSDFEKVLHKLPKILKNERVVAIGEIGLETTSPKEIDVFIQQLRIADDLKAKVIVHTPRTNKKEVTEITKNILLENIEPKRVLIDHVDFTIVDSLIDEQFTLGLTVQPLKMSPKDAFILLNDYGLEKFVLNSDMSSSPSDPLSVPKTVHELRMNGFDEKDIQLVSETNAAKFFNIS